MLSKLIILIMPIILITAVYMGKIYLDKDEFLTRAATKKYNYCIEQKRWGLKTYLDAKCPEYLFYIKNCYSECKTTAIKKIKEEL
jgi:hypothetical protein